jgi:predicted lipoprotein with Yx(FWY)xxD motif
MSTHPIILRHHIRRSAAIAAGVVTLGGSLLVSFPGSASAAPAHPTTIKVVHNKTWGNLLALGNGDTVYRFDADSKGKSNCSGTCAKVWPPVVLAAGQKSAVGKGVKDLGKIMRTNGAEQVTYQGIPLYTFIRDKKPLEVTGNLKDAFGRWGTINPAHPLAQPVAKVTGGSTTPTTKASGGSGAAF